MLFRTLPSSFSRLFILLSLLSALLSALSFCNSANISFRTISSHFWSDSSAIAFASLTWFSRASILSAVDSYLLSFACLLSSDSCNLSEWVWLLPVIRSNLSSFLLRLSSSNLIFLFIASTSASVSSLDFFSELTFCLVSSISTSYFSNSSALSLILVLRVLTIPAAIITLWLNHQGH